MTELFIDGSPVMLPKGMDLKVKQQNPLITKNGTFTLDQSLSLKERNNSILYKHLERLQSAAAIRNRNAVLMSNGRILLNGTEAIISNTNEDVKIQLLSGNSELNYFIKSDVFISELDLGREAELSAAYISKGGMFKYPKSSFCGSKVKVDSKFYNDADRNPCFQPYLLAMLEKTIMALGYTITVNELINDDLANGLYILNNIESTDYNKFLPGWKAIDFITECETFLNVAFDISEFDKTVRILRRTADSRFGTYTIDNVLDNYERTFDNSEKNVEISYKNVKYDFPSSTWYKYQDVEDEIMEKAEVKTMATYEDLCTLLEIKIEDFHPWIPVRVAEKYYKTLTVFYVTASDTYYMLEEFHYIVTGPGDTGEATWHYLRPINRFKKHVSNQDADFVSLKFLPAQMLYISAGSMWLWAVATIPYQSDKIDDTEKDETDLNKYIQNGVKDYNDSQKKICLSIAKYYQEGEPLLIDIGSAIDYVEDSAFCGEKMDFKHRTLRIEGQYGLYNRFYNVNQRYDTSKEYTIKFVIQTMPDVRAEFLFNNKMFVCKELEYRIMNEGIHSEVTGTFYAVK